MNKNEGIGGVYFTYTKIFRILHASEMPVPPVPGRWHGAVFLPAAGQTPQRAAPVPCLD